VAEVVGHRPWDCSVGEAIVRIVEDWEGWGDEVPTPGAVVWMELMPKGAVRAELVRVREAEAANAPEQGDKVPTHEARLDSNTVVTVF
jgi:hypothetical protein